MVKSISEEIELNVCETTSRPNGLLETQSNLPNNLGTGTVSNMYLNNFNICYTHVDYSSVPIKKVQKKDFSMMLHFELLGSKTYKPKNADRLTIKIPSGHYNFYSLKNIDGTLFCNKNKRKAIEFWFSPSYIEAILNKGFYEFSSDLKHAFIHQQDFLLFKSASLITNKIRNVIHQIINNNYTDNTFKITFLNIKTTELILLVFEDFITQKRKNKLCKVNLCNYYKIIQVEKILRKSPKANLDINFLAKEVGLNSNSLKVDFKIIYGKPVIRYHKEIKLAYAKNLILETQKTISEIAYEVGYQNPQHFTVAFKKQFNCLPRDLK